MRLPPCSLLIDSRAICAVPGRAAQNAAPESPFPVTLQGIAGFNLIGNDQIFRYDELVCKFIYI